MKKKVAIVFGITPNYCFALANVLIGMKKHCKKFWDDIIVFNQDVDKESIERLNSILPCVFIPYSLDKFSDSIKNDNIKTYSYLTMSRFECFRLLNDYQYVIWQDVDILVQDDFSDLLKYGDESGFALTYEPRLSVETNFFDCSIEKEYDVLKPLYNAGIMVLKDNLYDYNGIYDYCYSMFNKKADNLRFLDQAVINLLILDYGIKVSHIPLEKFCCHPTQKNYKDAAIIHCYGKDKFWNSDIRAIQFPEWKENNDIWEGGENRCSSEDKDKPIVSCFLKVDDASKIDFAAVKSIINQKDVKTELYINLVNEKDYSIIKDNLDLAGNNIILSKQVPLNEMQGDYFVLVDGLSYSLPNRFIKQIQCFKKNKNLFAVGTGIIKNSERKCFPNDYNSIRCLGLIRQPVFDNTVMFEKEKLSRCLGAGEKPYGFIFWNKILQDNYVENIEDYLVIEGFYNQKAWEYDFIRPDDATTAMIQNSFHNFFDVKLTYDDIMLIECPEMIARCYNFEIIKKERERVVDILEKANKQKIIFPANVFSKYFSEQQKKAICKPYKQIIQFSSGRKFVIWGTGRRFEKYMTENPSFPIEFCVDNNRDKNKTLLNNLPIKHPEDINDWKQYYIIISPIKVEEIEHQLESYGLKYLHDYAYGTDIF